MGQDLEPRAYSALPKNLNTVVVAYALSKGNVLTEPSLPINGLSITINISRGICSHLVRKTGGWYLPYILTACSANGEPTFRSGFGTQGSPRHQLTSLLDKKDFTQYTQKTIIGVSLVTSVPTGFYLRDKLINIGSHRWGFKPEVGISKRFNRLYAETYTGVWLYTNNSDYLGNKTLKQNPVVNIQAHACYFFKNRMMLSLNTTWFNGGKTTVNDVSAGNLLDNWRVGGTWSVPIAKGQSLKLQFHVGAFTTAGYDYDVVALSYQNVF
jgi:hypothetical protein